MNPEFWQERWHQNRIGFHQNEVNRFLCRHAARLKGSQACRVFVPLCGKSRDMLWLRDMGCEVFGVEISRLAVEAFYKEEGVDPKAEGQAASPVYSARGITVLVGDYFQLTPAITGPITAAYDRAALIAMPPERRPDYALRMAELLPRGAPLLLIAPYSLKDRHSGPPFAVSPEEISELFAPHFTIEVLERERETANDKPILLEQGLLWKEEAAYLLTRS